MCFVAACGGDGTSSTEAATTVTTATPGTTASGDGSDSGASLTTSTTTPTIPPTNSATKPGGGECTVTITGAREEAWTFKQALTSFSSDYWLSEADLRDTADFLGEDIMGGSYDDLVARGEAIITFLQVGCSDPENLIQGAVVAHTNATRADDLPMGTGTYPISGGLFDADGPAGTMIADLSVSEDDLYGTIPGTGTLEITRWDRDAIQGRFSFAARQAFVDDPEEIAVTVTFFFECTASYSGC